MNAPAPHRERGNVLFLILIAVALFAALGFAVSNILSSGNPTTIASEQARVYANEIIDHGRTIRQSIQNLRISNGCSQEEISVQFDSDSDGDYNDNDENYHNPNSPTDLSCHVFHLDGGGINYYSPNDLLLATDVGTPALYDEWYITGAINAGGVGTGVNELVLFFPYIKRSICIEINEALGITNPSGEPPVESGNAWTPTIRRFVGSYGSAAVLNQNSNLQGCFEGANASSTPPAGTYSYFQVLIVR